MVFYSAAPAGTSVATVNASTDDAVITFATPDGCTSGTSSMPAPVNVAEAKEDAAGASQG